MSCIYLNSSRSLYLTLRGDTQVAKVARCCPCVRGTWLSPHSCMRGDVPFAHGPHDILDTL